MDTPRGIPSYSHLRCYFPAPADLRSRIRYLLVHSPSEAYAGFLTLNNVDQLSVVVPVVKPKSNGVILSSMHALGVGSEVSDVL